MEIDAEPWWKLFNRSEAVGYKKKAGRFSFFSSDGYGWTGTPQDAELAVRELPIRDHANRRLFEGDVMTATWLGRQDAYLVLQDDSGHCYLGSTSGSLVKIPAHEIHRDLYVQRYIGNIFASSGLSADFDKSIRRFQCRDKHYLFDKLAMSAVATGSVVLGGFLQLRLFGAIGPLLTILSLLCGITTYLIIRKTFAQKWMSRGAIFAITPTVSSVTAIGLSLCFSFLLQPVTNDSQAPSWLIASALWTTIFLLCFGAIPITAQLLGFSLLKPVHQNDD